MSNFHKIYTMERYHAVESTNLPTVDTNGDFNVSILSTTAGNKYQFNDSGITAETIGISRGKNYVFFAESYSAHPFSLSLTADGVHGGGTAYPTGFTNFVSSGGASSFTFTADTSSPDDLYYYCTQHSGMGGRIRILDFDNTSADESFTQFGDEFTFDILGEFEDYSVTKVSQTLQLISTAQGTDTIIGFNRVEFNDGTLALDVGAGEVAGQAYRLYQAAFARTPDIAGVAFHMNDIETNGLSITEVANNFLASPEFKGKYGDGLSDEDYINALYTNVLSRSPADFEVEYYVDRFNNGTTDKATTLVFFAESPENVTLVGSQIENGIWLENI